MVCVNGVYMCWRLQHLLTTSTKHWLMHDNCKNYDRHNRKLIEQLKTHVLAPVITATDSIPVTADYGSLAVQTWRSRIFRVWI